VLSQGDPVFIRPDHWWYPDFHVENSFLHHENVENELIEAKKKSNFFERPGHKVIYK